MHRSEDVRAVVDSKVGKNNSEILSADVRLHPPMPVRRKRRAPRKMILQASLGDVGAMAYVAGSWRSLCYAFMCQSPVTWLAHETDYRCACHGGSGPF